MSYIQSNFEKTSGYFWSLDRISKHVFNIDNFDLVDDGDELP